MIPMTLLLSNIIHSFHIIESSLPHPSAEPRPNGFFLFTDLTFIFASFYYYCSTTAQQAYTDSNCNNATSALGYACNGFNRTCPAYLIYRPQPPYNTLPSIAALFSVDLSQVSAINRISESTVLSTNNEVIIPVSCSCTGKFYQVNINYHIQKEDSYYRIANDTFQGLTTCNAIRNEKPSPEELDIYPYEVLIIPLRCACPTEKQAREGIRYLVSYVIQPGNSISSIAAKFQADVGQTLEGNQKSEQESIIQPFTTLLLPLRNPPVLVTPSSGHTLNKLLIALIAVATSLLIILTIYFKRKYSTINHVIKVLQPMTRQEIETFLRNYGISGTKRYTYKNLKKITNSFKEKLGEGGYGIVYRGKLQNGQSVAVKFLKKSKGDSVEFLNEVVSIGRTNHKNIVTLLGFCYEGHKRALVYDFMPNGSLEKFINRGNNYESLALENLFQIAVGIARGLEYLHQGCNTRILHFDIKPHNILLDENFCPKISDFGLAKSFPQKESIISISGARGTVGYIAPEVFLRGFGGVSQKSDVYSYGMLILEMVGCRKSSDAEIECSTEHYFPRYIYKQLEQEEFDPEMLNGKVRELQRKMVSVSLWCIQTNPQSRPTMTKVVEMLEGTSESLQIPPMPTLASPLRSLSLHDSSTTETVSIS